MAKQIYKLGPIDCTFEAWRVGTGVVFDRPYALDIETTLIDPSQEWVAPKYVLAAACDGKKGFFLPPDRVLPFLQAHSHLPVIFHNAVFDLKVLDRLAGEQGAEVDVYDLVEDNLVADTLLLHRLYQLAEEGHTALGMGQSTLERCVQRYLGYELPKDVTDSAGNNVRTSYGQYLGRPPAEIEPVYLEYLARDAMATACLFTELVNRLQAVLESNRNAWGYVSDAWLDEQVERWGLQTHHIQLKAAIVLDAITANGIRVDQARTKELLHLVKTAVGEKETALARLGYTPGEGSSKVLQTLIGQVLAKHPDLKIARTDSGKWATSEEALLKLAPFAPFARELLDYKAANKLLTTYLGKMGKDRLHPRFDVLKTTGRTSSFGDINAQNLPRDDRIRRCFIPASGHLFLDADYSTIEMATLAQSVQSQFGQQSRMAEAINAGKDLHRLVAAKVTGKPETEVTKEERSKAKPINFGKPGGMGQTTLRDYARASYGVDLTEDEVASLEAAWFELFPEMEAFLEEGPDVTELLADRLGLTPSAYSSATGRYCRDDSSALEPASWLGGMCLKVLRDSEPATGSGRPYSEVEQEFFWDQLQGLANELPPKHRRALAERRPGPDLSWAVRNCLSNAGVFTLTGRLRAGATYCARHNTVFQGLAADGAKIALWQLWRAGYQLVNFIHDEVLIEVSKKADLPAVAAEVEQIMVEAMREVVPDVSVKVEWSYRRCWGKSEEDEVSPVAAAA